MPAVRGVEHAGKRRHVVKQAMCQRTHGLLLVVNQQLQIGLAATGDHATLVLVVFTLLATRDRRAVTKQAHQQQHIGKQALLGRNANVNERVQVEQPHLDILHTQCAQRLGRAHAIGGNAFGAHGGVKLGLDLQQVGTELFPMRAVTHAELRVIRVHAANGDFQPLAVFRQGIEADAEFFLGVVLVTQVTHAQACGKRAMQRAGGQLGQVRRMALQERLAQRRGGAKQVRHQPAISQKVANQAKVTGVDEVLQVSRAGATVTQGQPEILW